MPVIVNSTQAHPFLPTFGDGAAIDARRAERQDIRPLEILIINLMADKQTTEKQLARWLGHTPLQVHLTFAATDSYMQDVQNGRQTRNTPADHIRKYYKAFGAVKNQKFDGLIVTGVNALKAHVTEEDIWLEVETILRWSETNVLSSLFLCWGAKAALKYFHDIESYKGEHKLFGLFTHCLVSDKTGLLFGLPDQFPVPVSRWKSPRRDDIEQTPVLEIVADSDESGPNILVEAQTYNNGQSLFVRRAYVLNHPEYETETLRVEYERDCHRPDAAVPQHYFPGDDPAQPPINSWRHTAIIYSNWVKNIYEATPYRLENLPNPFNPDI